MPEVSKQKLIVIGKHGIGKTTLIKRMLGLMPRDLPRSGFLIQLDKTRSKRIKGLKFILIKNGRKEIEIPIARIKEDNKPSKRLPINLDNFELELTLMKSVILDLLNEPLEPSHLLVIDEWGPILENPELTEVKNQIISKLQDDKTFLLLTVDNSYREKVMKLLDSSRSTIFNLAKNNQDKIRERLLMAVIGYHSQFKSQELESWKVRLATWFEILEEQKTPLTMPKIVLRGPPRVGKTTIIEKFLRRYGEQFKLRGFYTKELKDFTKKRIGFEARLINGGRAVLAHVGISGPRVARYGVDLSVINDFLIPAIKPPYTRDELVIVDEIGKMELLSTNFQEMVIKVLDHPEAFVLATMRDPPTSFMQRLLRYKNVIAIPVTPHNRGELPDELGEMLTSVVERLR